MSRLAIKSGKRLEKAVLNNLEPLSSIITNKTYTYGMCGVTVPQYRYSDIFTPKAKIDFLFVNKTGKKFFIECKNQKVQGSVDTKFPYYIVNMQQKKYKDSTFIFVLNTKGVRKSVLQWLIAQAEIYDFYIVSNLRLKFLKNIFEGCDQKVYI